MLFKRSKYFPGRPTNAGLIVIFLLIITTYYLTNEMRGKRFPYINRDENISLLVENRSISSVDTLHLILKSKDKFVAINRRNAIYVERSDSLVGYYEFKNFDTIFHTYNPPFKKYINPKDTLTPFTIFSYPLSEGDQWYDERYGLIHQFEGSDSIYIMDRKLECVKVNRFLSSDSIRKFEVVAEGDSSIYKVHKDYYTTEHGWVKTEYPDGSTSTLINFKELYWYERVPRFFGFGVK